MSSKAEERLKQQLQDLYQQAREQQELKQAQC